MQSLQKHAPEMKEIQRKYKGDRQKMNEEMMKFYRENKINPAASCLPLLAQAPVFISLYLVLRNFSKHVPPGSDLSWLHFVPDITAKANSGWYGYVLLATYAASQVFSTYFMSQAMDKLQRRLMMILPLVFITVIANFPIGLVIYWVTTNLWTVGQGLVTRRLVPKTPPAPLSGPKRSSRTPSPSSDDGSSGNGVKTAPEPKSAPEPAPAPEPKPRQPSTQPRRVKRNKGHGRR
jgi:YidC/Oxa1 family membrane protein insertase